MAMTNQEGLRANDTVALNQEGLKVFRGKSRNFNGVWAERTGTVLWTPRGASVAVCWAGGNTEQYVACAFLRRVEGADQVIRELNP